ncbi:helix-turn-helix transcriptional regulator [Streptomyces griseofuscus]|uniref:helix-turn-helix transcriptional regulator n=1 Tax=Streptomyces griseofuscus TaxID=146922 RepID=UPI0034563FD5
MATAPALIGRTEHLHRLSELARRAARGERQVVFLAGPVGIGKTAIAEAFAAGLNGFRQVRFAGMPGERLIGFAAVNRLLHMLRGDRRGSRDEVAADSTVLAAAGALLNAVDDFGGGLALLLLVDDAHLVDVVSLQALAFMLLRMPGDRLLAVVNTEHAYETRRDMGFVRDQPGITQIDVGGLTGKETRDFLTAMGVVPVSCSRLAAIHRWSAGNPLYLRALVRPGGPAGLPPENPAHGPIPPSLTQIVQDWVGTFPPGSTRVLDALAVLQAPADLPLLRHMTGSLSLLEDIEPLIKEQAARWMAAGADDDRIVLTHQGQQDVLYAGIPLARRKELHRAAAEVLDPPERWRHRIAASESYDGALARSLRAAVDAELDHGDPVRAAQYLLGISKVDPDASARGAGLLQAVRLLVVSGHYQPALALAPRVLAGAAGPGRAEALGLLELARGHDTGAAEHLLQAWRGYGGDEEQASRAAMELATAQASLGLGRQVVRAAQFAVAHSADPAVIGRAQSVITYARALLAGPADALLYVSHLRENPADVPVYDLHSLALRGILRSMTGQLHAALSDLTVVIRRGHLDDLARRGGFSAVVHAAACHIMLGGWTEARRLLSLGFDEAQTVGRETDFVVLHTLSAMLAGFQGRWSTAQQDMAEARALVAASDFSGPHFQLAQTSAALAFARQDWHAVVDSLTRVLDEPSNRERARIYRIWTLPLLGVAHARLGDEQAAQEAAAGLDELAPYGAFAAVCAAWVRGNTAAARRDVHTALRHLRDGLALGSYGGEPVLPRTLLRCDYGRCLIEAGQGSEAERQLTQAAGVFREMGAGALEAPCVRLLEQIDSVIPVSRAEHFWEELTDRERDVAQLVGQGWTNKEIARELYVTMKTVEYHLRNIYVKGDAQNRRQVRDLVQMLRAAGN